MLTSEDLIKLLSNLNNINEFTTLLKEIVEINIKLCNYTENSGIKQDNDLSITFNLSTDLFRKFRKLRNDLVHYNKNSESKEDFYIISDNAEFVGFNLDSIVDSIKIRLSDLLSII